MVTVLAIGAHPDDIEIGCSATLLKHKRNGAKIYLLVLTKGEASGDPEIREKECRRAAELIGAERIIFGELEDTKIDDGIKTILTIEKMIHQVNPDIIYTHTLKDTHQDHRNTAFATLSAGRRCKKIFMYESPRTFREFSPQLYIDVDEEFQQKKKILSLFSSQSEKEWWAIGPKATLALEGLALFRGFQAGVQWAEAFEVSKMVISNKELFFNNNIF